MDQFTDRVKAIVAAAEQLTTKIALHCKHGAIAESEFDPKLSMMSTLEFSPERKLYTITLVQGKSVFNFLLGEQLVHLSDSILDTILHVWQIESTDREALLIRDFERDYDELVDAMAEKMWRLIEATGLDRGERIDAEAAMRAIEIINPFKEHFQDAFLLGKVTLRWYVNEIDELLSYDGIKQMLRGAGVNYDTKVSHDFAKVYFHTKPMQVRLDEEFLLKAAIGDIRPLKRFRGDYF